MSVINTEWREATVFPKKVTYHSFTNLPALFGGIHRISNSACRPAELIPVSNRTTSDVVNYISQQYGKDRSQMSANALTLRSADAVTQLIDEISDLHHVPIDSVNTTLLVDTNIELDLPVYTDPLHNVIFIPNDNGSAISTTNNGISRIDIGNDDYDVSIVAGVYHLADTLLPAQIVDALDGNEWICTNSPGAIVQNFSLNHSFFDPYLPPFEFHGSTYDKQLRVNSVAWRNSVKINPTLQPPNNLTSYGIYYHNPVLINIKSKDSGEIRGQNVAYWMESIF
ncbi:MAG: hypothetical protein ACEQSA_02650 [Weeksellaceae bacterium]